MPILYMLIGLPASGKSTYAAKVECPVVSSDAIREELYGDVNDQTHNNEVFNEVHRRIKSHLANGEDVIYDATNLSAKRRKGFLSQIPKDVYKIAVLFATDIEIVLKQNAERERHVPEDVIWRMYRNFNFPELSEGFDLVTVRRHALNESFDYHLAKCKDFNQENPHHAETLDMHMLNATLYVDRNFPISDLLPDEEISKLERERFITSAAAMYHDIGKPDTKTFIKPNGVVDTIAHYYNHENVGAYILACIGKDGFPTPYTDKELHDMIALVQHHMDGYNYKNDADYAKFGGEYGENLRERIKLIHEADINAH